MMDATGQGSASLSAKALANFHELAEVLAENFRANAIVEGNPRTQLIVVLGASASDIKPLPSWSTVDLKQKILDEVRPIFQKEEDFLREICRLFSRELGRHLWNSSSDEMRKAILKDLSVEKISSAACQMSGHADFKVRDLISKAYAALDQAADGPPPHLTYELLAHLMMHGFINHVVTMNFDEMLDNALENELGPRGFKRIITGHEPLEDTDARVPRLFKVHGTASSPESLRFTYAEVSVLTSAQAKHLNKLLERTGATGCGCVNLVSFGYSWQDPDLAHWVLAHLGKFQSIFIVRRKKGWPVIFKEQRKNLSRKDQRRFRVLPIDALCGGEAVPSRLFWWALVDEVWTRLKREKEPLIPFARHLLLGNLVSPSKSNMVLESRVRLEILLHLLKSKGMINTFGAPDSPRIRAYFSKLRNRPASVVTVEDFIRESNLGKLMQRSPEPEARDTFFSTANSREGLVEGVSSAFLSEALGTIKRPVFEKGLLAGRDIEAMGFIREQAKRIVEGPEIEISREVNAKLHWIFSQPIPILSFPQFATAIRNVLSFQWTHLLAIVESTRWLEYSWTKDLFEGVQGKRILMILPSSEGLDAWRVGSEIRRIEQASIPGKEVFELEIPWWAHNRHIFLPVRLDNAEATLGPGVFYLREYKSPAIAPVLLKQPRDQAKLLATFILYTQRTSIKKKSGLSGELKCVVEQLLARGGIDEDMVDLVRKAYSRMLEVLHDE